MKKLVVSDWSGTIDLSLHVFDEAYRRTVNELFGIIGSMYDDPSYVASTNADVVAEIAKAHGIPEEAISLKRELILPAYQRNFLEALKGKGSNILPGVRELFLGLKKNGIFLSLVSGESKITLNALVENAGFGQYFPEDMRSSGEEVESRAGLIGLPIKRAEERHGQFPRNGIYLLEDSVRGVDAGNSSGIITVAVATGPTKYEELRLSRPVHIFSDLKGKCTSCHKKVLAIICE